MGHMIDGIKPMVDYAGLATNALRLDAFIAAIPDPDTTSTSGAQQGIPGFLDEMSPITAAQLRVELTALKAVIVEAT